MPRHGYRSIFHRIWFQKATVAAAGVIIVLFIDIMVGVVAADINIATVTSDIVAAAIFSIVLIGRVIYQFFL